MPYELRKEHKKFCVYNKTTGESKGCSDTRDDAVGHMRALYAAESNMAVEEALSLLEDDNDNDQEVETFTYSDNMKEYPWEGPIVFENVTTGDNRVFKSQSINWEPETLPWAFRWQKSSGQGHAGSVPVGRVDGIKRMEDGSIHGFGVVIPGLSSEATEYLNLLKTGVGGGVSVDGDSAQFEIQENEGGQPKVEFSSMRLRALSAVDIPAFNGARIHLVGQPELSGEENEIFDTEAEELAKKKHKMAKNLMATGWNFDAALIASAIPVIPSTLSFIEPKFDGPTPLTVTPDGKVFGHLALFNTCHIGFPGTCVKPPKGSAYQYFHTGQVETAEGDMVDVGHLTFGTGHATMNASPKGAAEHYDNTGTVAADVRAGEDEFGIWVVGALRPGLTEENIREFRAAPLSGDWRRIAGKLELVGALAVNVPGFPVPRIKALVASGETETLFTFLEDDAEDFYSDYEFTLRQNKKAQLIARLGPAELSAYELSLRSNKKIELASKLAKLVDSADEPTPTTDEKIPDLPAAPTKADLKKAGESISKADFFAGLKTMREVLDDPTETISAKTRKSMETIYGLFIENTGGKSLTASGYDLDIIEASGLDIDEWEAELEFSGLDVVEFYNQCHDKGGKFCGKGGGGGAVIGRHFIEGAKPGGPGHPHTQEELAKPKSEGGHGYTPGGGKPSGGGGSGGGGGGSGGGGDVSPKTYENYRNARTRAVKWIAVTTVAYAALSSHTAAWVLPILRPLLPSLLANPGIFALVAAAGAVYAAKNFNSARKHRADYNRQVDKKLKLDALKERQNRERTRVQNA